MTLASGRLGSLGVAAMNQPMPRFRGLSPHLRARGLTLRRGERLLFADLLVELQARWGAAAARAERGGEVDAALGAGDRAAGRRDDARWAGATGWTCFNYQSGLKGRLDGQREPEILAGELNGADGLAVERGTGAVGIWRARGAGGGVPVVGAAAGGWRWRGFWSRSGRSGCWMSRARRSMHRGRGAAGAADRCASGAWAALR